MKSIVTLFFVSLGCLILAFIVEGILGAKGSAGLWNWLYNFVTVAPGSWGDVSLLARILCILSAIAALTVLVLIIVLTIKSNRRHGK